MASNKPRIRRQTAPVVIDTTGPIRIDGVIAYDGDGNPVGRVGVGVEVDADERDE